MRVRNHSLGGTTTLGIIEPTARPALSRWRAPSRTRERTMITQGRLGTRDLPRAKVFYDAIAKLLGAECVRDMPNAVFYRGKAGTMLIIGLPFAGEATVGNGVMLGIEVPSRDIVDAVFAKAIELGGT